jgi:hypothetical protein
MTVQRFVHLSDIHFGQEKNGTLVKHDHIRNALITDAKDLASKRGSAARILVTGDISYSGKSEEYKKATEWLEKLTKVCGCEETHVSTIPGNHDCDRDAISNQARMVCATLRASTPEVLQATLHGINQDGEAANPFLPKLHAYRQFANAYGCDFESPIRPLWVRHFDLSGGIRLRFIGFTSVQISDRDDAPGKMILGNEQYTIAEEENVVNVVLVHHPLDWFMDKTEASQHLLNNARVIMVGHEHTLNIQKTQDGFTQKEWLVIYAGATNPPEVNGTYSFTYNWLEFSCTEKGGQSHLIVEVFPRVWVQERVRFDADRARIAGSAESLKIEIPCPNLRPISEPQKASAAVTVHGTSSSAFVKEDSPEASSSTSLTAEPLPARQGGSSMDNYNVGFDRLRYLFWQYLDWRQRLKVLVDVDALPKTADQPVPQTMERVALETAAKSQEKLHDLWEAVMPLIPQDKRGANPFQSSKR